MKREENKDKSEHPHVLLLHDPVGYGESPPQVSATMNSIMPPVPFLTVVNCALLKL